MSKENFEKVNGFLLDLNMEITHTDEAEELFIVSDEENAVKNLVVDCEDPILVLEQVIMPVPEDNTEAFFKSILEMNRTLVHGAFVLDAENSRVIWRDTLQLENLDLNELEGSINALELALGENAAQLVGFAHAGQ